VPASTPRGHPDLEKAWGTPGGNPCASQTASGSLAQVGRRTRCAEPDQATVERECVCVRERVCHSHTHLSACLAKFLLLRFLLLFLFILASSLSDHPDLLTCSLVILPRRRWWGHLGADPECEQWQAKGEDAQGRALIECLIECYMAHVYSRMTTGGQLATRLRTLPGHRPLPRLPSLSLPSSSRSRAGLKNESTRLSSLLLLLLTRRRSSPGGHQDLP
jgi:hypothetical protein